MRSTNTKVGLHRHDRILIFLCLFIRTITETQFGVNGQLSLLGAQVSNVQAVTDSHMFDYIFLYWKGLKKKKNKVHFCLVDLKG